MSNGIQILSNGIDLIYNNKQTNLFDSYQKDINSVQIERKPINNMITVESNENEENIFTYSDSKVMTNNTYMNSKLMTKYSNENNKSSKDKILYTFVSKGET